MTCFCATIRRVSTIDAVLGLAAKRSFTADAVDALDISMGRARGHARNPVSLDELHSKFDDCVAGALAPDARGRLFERLFGLETLAEVAVLYGE